jgi:hypothetical protein
MLDQAPYSAPKDPKRTFPRFAHLGDILMIGVAVGLVVFLAALITAILTSGGG